MKSKALILLIFISINALAQYTSYIKGKVIDKQSKFPITGARIIVKNTEPLLGAASDFNGDFSIEDVSIGRYTIEISYLGYKPQTLPNIVVEAGKDAFLTIQLEESVEQLEEVIIKGTNKQEVQNKMASVSARTISLEEGTKYSGSLQDIARIAQNYAGVSGASDDRNDIIIRGNSPLGVLWRMEDIDIPSPNHFSTLGTTGGPISMLNANNLSNSDFMTSAWSADYGNALSGVFDLKMRNGNKDKREYMGQMGFNGFEFGTEGPFKKGSKTSYMANYRYSNLWLFDALGFDLGTGGSIPNYTDLTFKIHSPTKKYGTFTLWGIGGRSDIFSEANPNGDSTNIYTESDEESKFISQTYMLGGSHLYFINDKTFTKISFGASHTRNDGLIKLVDFDTDTKSLLSDFRRKQTKLTTHYKLNKKFNAKNNLTFGIIADQYFLYTFDSTLVRRADSIIPENIYKKFTDSKDELGLYQSYINWQHKFTDEITLNMGLHSQHFFLSDDHWVEPRLGLRYQIHNRHTLSFGSGVHSQLQPITLYFNSETDANGNQTFPNKSVGFTKAIHNVLGYDFVISENLRIKTEVYYQSIFEVPVDKDTATHFSMLNQGADFELPLGTGYENTGTGYNYGLEVTLEKFFSKNYYFLFTTSFFESKYKGSDNIERNTLFNGNYVINGLAGKEFKLAKNMTLSFDTKLTTAGGRRYTPINFSQSAIEGREVRIYSQAYTQQYKPYFRADFKIGFKQDFKKVTQKISVDLQNITDHDNIFLEQYVPSTNSIQTINQRGFLPIVLYQLFF